MSSIAITLSRKTDFINDTSCSYSAIFCGNLLCTGDVLQTATLVQWRHNISTVLTFQSSTIQKAWRVPRGLAASLQWFRDHIALIVMLLKTSY
jgi:hypothetical protein